MASKEPYITAEYGPGADGYGPGTTLVTFNDTHILETGQIDKLKELLAPVIKKTDQGKLVLNFSNVQSLSSAMLGLLLTIHKRMREQSGDMEIWNLNKNIIKVFEITQLTKIFNIK
jgi:anti-sigma B factor antagonist